MDPELHLRTLDHMLEGCQIIGHDWRYIYLNRSAALQGRRSPEELVGRTMMEAYPGIEGTELFTALQACMKDRSTAALENEFRNPDGTVGWFQLSIEPHPEGVFILSIDVSQRVHMERLANRKQRLESLGTLAGGVAHDLNNAISPILLGVELLRTEHPAAEDIAEMFESSVRRASDIVRQLLTFAKGSDGQRIPVAPGDIVNEMERFLRSFPRSITVACSCAPDLPRLSVDPTQVHQVLLNLCINARDAMPGGGTLSLDATRVEVDEAFATAVLGARPGDFVAFRVRDTGAGMTQDVLERIFEPFFTTKPSTSGTGLGLSTSMGIVNGHGGFMHVYSEPGAGTTMKVYFPIASAGDTSRPGEGATGFHGAGRTVLVVDDDARMRRAAQVALEQLGFRVLQAIDGDEAMTVTVAAEGGIAAVMLDLHMPRKDGLRFIAELPDALAGVPIVVVSGGLDEPTAARLDALGLHRRVEKPFTRAALERVMSSIFG